jgi:hypothetical protein
MTILANLSNGNQAQIIVKGDQKKIVAFIEAYEGDDLGNDLICESFVEDFEETGVIIDAPNA